MDGRAEQSHSIQLHCERFPKIELNLRTKQIYYDSDHARDKQNSVAPRTVTVRWGKEKEEEDANGIISDGYMCFIYMGMCYVCVHKSCGDDAPTHRRTDTPNKCNFLAK